MGRRCATVAAAPAEWRSTADGVNVRDDESSTRNPDAWAAVPTAELRTVADLLSPATASTVS